MKLLLLFYISLSSCAAYAQVVPTATTPMRLIPGGEFVMGKTHQGFADFSPEHRVRLDSFLIDEHEVTNAQYLVFCEATGHKLPEFWNTPIFRSGRGFENYPVTGISWWDAKAYAEWAGKRLPTEAEWEYAARGGLVGMDFPNGNTWLQQSLPPDSTGWTNRTEPVKTYEPNGYGLHDMGGNVWEWVADFYSETYYQQNESDNPQGPPNGSFRSLRGGSWHSGSMCKRVYYRRGLPGNWCDFAVGFRCAKNVE